MTQLSLPQFEHEYDVYKMRQLTDELTRGFQRVQNDINSINAGGGGGGGVTVHNDLTGRSAADAHPTSAITGLDASLSSILASIAVNTTNISVNTADIATLDATLTAHIADASIHFTVASIDHGSIAGLADDDHLQYLLLLGRAGGQTAIGDSAVGGQLFLQGSTAGANRGLVTLNSPLTFDDVTDGVLLSSAFINNVTTQTLTIGFVGGGVRMSPTIDFSNALFVWFALEGNPVITSGVNPVFAAFTLFQGIPRLRSVTAGFNPLQSLTLNAGATIENAGAAIALTAANNTAVNAAMQTRASAAFATMNMTNITGMTFSPTFSTVNLSVVNMGTLVGLQMNNPTVALFQPQAGTENMTAYVGLNMVNITFGGNVLKAAVQSAQAAATNAYFLRQTGGAQSVLLGQLRFEVDLTGITFGASNDMNMGWGGANFFFLNYVTAPAGQLRFSSVTVGNTTQRHLIEASVQDAELNLNFDRFSIGAQSGAVGNGVGVFVTPTRATSVNGDWADFNLTHAGNITIDHTIGQLLAWNLNALSITAGAGTLNGPVVTFNIGGMTTSGLAGAATHALRVTGRRTGRGVDAFEPLDPAALTADVNDYQPATGNAMRQWWRLTTDDLGARNVTGIAVQQTEDTQWITNVGTVDNIVLQHQNAGSVAANRIISPTGADYTLGPDESAALIYDATTARWRIIWGTGA